MKKAFRLPLIGLFTLLVISASAQNKILVFQSDFGLKDGAVSAMKGVAMTVSPDLKIFDLTHDIPPFNIWEAAYRLKQTAQYWPVGTVFVSVVDPGVGSQRKSVVLKTKTGYFFVTPDNGTLTLIAETMGIAEIREIDETKNRRQGSGDSYTFHGRDVYAYTGARLASGTISFEEVGPALPPQVVTIDYQKPVLENGVIKGNIPILDIQFGNVWTNIDEATFKQLNVSHGDSLAVTIFHAKQQVYQATLPFEATFSGVALKKPLVYLNSLLNISLALNQGSFAAKYKILSGPDWSIAIKKTAK
ncbi:MAG TPA: S-adenosyl-l-methionine hydroxide adenosyltransferase family protein [Chitinophagaceae bacterium]|nr:S-adenosyl-l-methionine hydroxide adenosyltransferase family protein [Chitinophagaceae bacterium]